ncbi:MAG: superoxide dismutase family protein [Proteobacteria bacterium]|nr:superoxide dismutase family protein [Pseudomonadota bacterium]MCL2307188.1 superoxide dismutase family protein [Pseudomonadota bacterium]
MKRVGCWAVLAAAVLGALLLGGCATLFGGKDRAIATIMPTQGHQARGTVWLEQRGARVMVMVDLQGLTPDSEHGFHVHELGNCSAPDASSAGGHFNPDDQPHGHHGASPRHAGDLPNLKADSRGIAKVSFEVDGISVWPGSRSIIGRSLVVHSAPDDYRSQPTGNSGARIGCGVIGLQ